MGVLFNAWFLAYGSIKTTELAYSSVDSAAGVSEVLSGTLAWGVTELPQTQASSSLLEFPLVRALFVWFTTCRLWASRCSSPFRASRRFSAGSSGSGMTPASVNSTQGSARSRLRFRQSCGPPGSARHLL